MHTAATTGWLLVMVISHLPEAARQREQAELSQGSLVKQWEIKVRALVRPEGAQLHAML